MSTAYHPQMDGQTERVNQCLETFLRCFVSACPRKWKSWLALVEFWYNSSFHSAIGQSPLEALYGYSLRHFGIQLANQCEVSSLDQWMQDRSLMNELIRQHLNRAMVRMERQADKSRLERSFEVGDLVFLKLQPYIQSSLAPHSNQKLAFKFFTSFQVVQKVGQVAYKLDLPPSLVVHPVFHVSQLKKAIGANV
jgi:hypothetical protein